MSKKLELLKSLLPLILEESAGAETEPETTNAAKKDFGLQIVVVDRGFVFAGHVTMDRDFTYIENAKCIRRWGTSAGLGQLVNGPLAETKADPSGSVMIPSKSVIHFIKCAKGW